MNVRIAVVETLELVDSSDFRLVGGEPIPSTDYTSLKHLMKMAAKIASGEVTGEKSHRWLGFIQGVVHTRFEVSVEALTEINKRS